jgi:hypothetical protein
LTTKLLFMAENTLFQKIMDREEPGYILYEDDQCVALRDINPQAPTHILIVPRQAYPHARRPNRGRRSTRRTPVPGGAEGRRRGGVDGRIPHSFQQRFGRATDGGAHPPAPHRWAQDVLPSRLRAPKVELIKATSSLFLEYFGNSSSQHCTAAHEPERKGLPTENVAGSSPAERALCAATMQQPR